MSRTNIAPYGSLLKTPGQPRKVGKIIKETRQKDEAHLALIRQLPCLSCGKSPCDAAHVRMASAVHGKQPGIVKPDDCWTLPLCHADHMDQHAQGENEFWARLGIDPIDACLKLVAAGTLEKMLRVVRVIRGALVLNKSTRSRSE